MMMGAVLFITFEFMAWLMCSTVSVLELLLILTKLLMLITNLEQNEN